MEADGEGRTAKVVKSLILKPLLQKYKRQNEGEGKRGKGGGVGLIITKKKCHIFIAS